MTKPPESLSSTARSAAKSATATERGPSVATIDLMLPMSAASAASPIMMSAEVSAITKPPAILSSKTCAVAKSAIDTVTCPVPVTVIALILAKSAASWAA